MNVAHNNFSTEVENFVKFPRINPFLHIFRESAKDFHLFKGIYVAFSSPISKKIKLFHSFSVSVSVKYFSKEFCFVKKFSVKCFSRNR